MTMHPKPPVTADAPIHPFLLIFLFSFMIKIRAEVEIANTIRP